MAILLSKIDLKDTHTIWFDKNNAQEFESIRNKILQDDKIDTFNYRKDRLVIQNHIKYGVVFLEDTPLMCGGLYNLKEYSSNKPLGRILNRFYVFPKYRGNILKDFKVSVPFFMDRLVNPLIEISPLSAHIFTHLNKSENKKFGQWFSDAVNEYCGFKKWHVVPGLVKTTGSDKDPSVWQWCITDNPDYPFKKINIDQWLVIKEYFDNRKV